MEHWFGEAETYASPGVIKCLVGSKTDKAASRAVTYEEGAELAKKFGAMFVEVSSKNRENVRRPFVDVVDKIVETPELVRPAARRATGNGAGVGADGSVQVGLASNADQGWGCAC